MSIPENHWVVYTSKSSWCVFL